MSAWDCANEHFVNGSMHLLWLTVSMYIHAYILHAKMLSCLTHVNTVVIRYSAIRPQNKLTISLYYRFDQNAI